MNPIKVTMTARPINAHTAAIDVKGDVNAQAENVLMDAYTQATAGSVKNIVLNFTGLEFMNSSGIGLLVTLLIRANRQGDKLCAVGLSDHYRQIFELTRLNEAIKIYNSEAEAAM